MRLFWALRASTPSRVLQGNFLAYFSLIDYDRRAAPVLAARLIFDFLIIFYISHSIGLFLTDLVFHSSFLTAVSQHLIKICTSGLENLLASVQVFVFLKFLRCQLVCHLYLVTADAAVDARFVDARGREFDEVLAAGGQ